MPCASSVLMLNSCSNSWTVWYSLGTPVVWWITNLNVSFFLLMYFWDNREIWVKNKVHKTDVSAKAVGEERIRDVLRVYNPHTGMAQFTAYRTLVSCWY